MEDKLTTIELLKIVGESILSQSLEEDHNVKYYLVLNLKDIWIAHTLKMHICIIKIKHI